MPLRVAAIAHSFLRRGFKLLLARCFPSRPFASPKADSVEARSAGASTEEMFVTEDLADSNATLECFGMLLG
jgi:hypothetical protein